MGKPGAIQLFAVGCVYSSQHGNQMLAHNGVSLASLGLCGKFRSLVGRQGRGAL